MFPQGYAYLTLGAARTELAARLEDPTYTHWTAVELNELIVESVRTWQALTGTYKQRVQFPISPSGGVGGSAFYDLNSIVPALGFFVTDEMICNRLLDVLLEPRLAPGWTGTGQYYWEQIRSALQNRINRWLEDTGANVTRQLQPAAAAPQLFLPEATLDVRRAAWVSSTGTYTTLWRDDEFASQSFLYYANPTDPPKVWAKFLQPPVAINLYPPPAAPGQVETLVVTSGPEIGATPDQVGFTPTALDIPEDFTWGMVFGALSDLFNADGPARDPDRAMYAESRYQESVELYKLNPTLLATQIDNVPIWTGSVFEMDSFLASWQMQVGPPQFAGMCDRNLAAFGPTPDQMRMVTADFVGNIPIPVQDADVLQVDRGALGPLLDYAFHLAAYKMAGAEFKAADKLRQNFYKAAAGENSRLTRANFYRKAFERPATRQQSEVPRL